MFGPGRRGIACAFISLVALGGSLAIYYQYLLSDISITTEMNTETKIVTDFISRADAPIAAKLSTDGSPGYLGARTTSQDIKTPATLKPIPSLGDNREGEGGLSSLATRKGSINNTFDYAGFWNSSFKIALENNKSLATHIENSSKSTCPKVYIYELTKDLHDGRPQKNKLKFRQVFGKPIDMNGHLYNTNQYGFANILEYRLRNSKQGCYTTDPNEADLFYVPIHPYPKGRKGEC